MRLRCSSQRRFRESSRSECANAEPCGNECFRVLQAFELGEADPDNFIGRRPKIRHSHDLNPRAIRRKHTVLTILECEALVRRFPKASSRKRIDGRIGLAMRDLIASGNRIEEVEYADTR